MGKMLQCTNHECEHQWNYTGNRPFYAQCPRCRSNVKIEKGIQAYKESKRKK